MKKIPILPEILFMLLISTVVHAQWSNNPGVNNAICTLSGEQAIPKIATCPNGDTYIGYFSSETGNYDVRLQRLDAAGNIKWAAGGILISNNPQNTWLTDWDMTCDNANHAILAFNDIRTGNTNVVVYRISPDGNFVWGNNGILLSNTTAFNAAPRVISTAAGNIVVAWSADAVVKVQKLNPAGAIQWTAGGITISSANDITWPQLLPVGADDVILKYFNDSGPPNAPTRHVYAQRYDATGVAVWPAATVISNAGGISAWTQIFPFINDGSDGFYICWHDDRDNNQRASSFIQHISNTGAVLFTANGVEVSNQSNMNHYYPAMALPPGSTDVYVFWNEMNTLQSQWGLFGQKIDASGALQWGSAGMTFIPVSTTDVLPYAVRHSDTDVVLFYEQYTDAINGTIKAMRISPSGSFVWSPGSKDICTVNSQKVHPEVNEFNNNQWIVTWEDTRNGVTDIFAQNIQLDGSLGPVLLGSVQGQVTITGEPADVTLATVTAGSVAVHPDMTGHYAMQLPEGTYAVTATHPYTSAQTISNVAVVSGIPTSNVNFILTVNRADMVVTAIDQFGLFLNNVDVVIQGPEGPYNGTITNNALVFPHVPYGSYQGSATIGAAGPVVRDTTISAVNHNLQFVFLLTEIPEYRAAFDLQVFPQPAGAGSMLRLNVPVAGLWHFELYDMTGRLISDLAKQLCQGLCTIPFHQLTSRPLQGGGLRKLIVTGPSGEKTHCTIVLKPE